MKYQPFIVLFLIIASLVFSFNALGINSNGTICDSIEISSEAQFLYIDGQGNTDTMQLIQLDSFYISKTYCKPGTTLHTFQILKHPDYNRNK